MTAGTGIEVAAAPPLVIDRVDPQHLQALTLLAEAGIEARTLYPELFAPDSPAPTNAPLGEREVYLLAWREGVAVGCGALRRVDAATGEIRRMFVTRGARREGVARALLARLEADAIALGYRRLVLETGTRQKAALALYRGAGWRRIAAYGVFVDDPTSVCLGKSLRRVATRSGSAGGVDPLGGRPAEAGFGALSTAPTAPPSAGTSAPARPRSRAAGRRPTR
jgi:putative acetyltransferase